MRKEIKRSKKEEGHSVLEFALVAIPTIFLMLGTVVIGIDLGRAVQVFQICRDADAMYVRGAPLYSTSGQNFLVQLGQNMNLQTSGGDGLVTLSKIQFIPDSSCGTPPAANCTSGKYVLVQRIIVGNTSLPGTHYPTAGAVTYDSLDQVANYTTDPNAVVSNFSSSLQLKPNEVSYVAETYFQTTSVNFGSEQTSPGIYSQAFF
ncbi:MAG TPA: TadE family protein [Bryobacteraceae bacterium]|nr:TadE family protein [Bryobacteraceae bacterium]